MTDGRTHWEGCWREPGHHECAVAQIERLIALNAEMAEACDLARLFFRSIQFNRDRDTLAAAAKDAICAVLSRARETRGDS